MNAPLFVEILEKSLVPFIRAVYRFVQDNDPKHCSNFARRFYERAGINWWPTPPESPDCNPIENVWHELKEYSKRSKAQNKARTDYRNQGILGNCVSGEVQEVHQPPEEGDPSCHL